MLTNLREFTCAKKEHALIPIPHNEGDSVLLRRVLARPLGDAISGAAA